MRDFQKHIHHILLQPFSLQKRGQFIWIGFIPFSQVQVWFSNHNLIYQTVAVLVLNVQLDHIELCHYSNIFVSITPRRKLTSNNYALLNQCLSDDALLNQCSSPCQMFSMIKFKLFFSHFFQCRRLFRAFNQFLHIEQENTVVIYEAYILMRHVCFMYL